MKEMRLGEGRRNGVNEGQGGKIVVRWVGQAGMGMGNN